MNHEQNVQHKKAMLSYVLSDYVHACVKACDFFDLQDTWTKHDINPKQREQRNRRGCQTYSTSKPTDLSLRVGIKGASRRADDVMNKRSLSVCLSAQVISLSDLGVRHCLCSLFKGL